MSNVKDEQTEHPNNPRVRRRLAAFHALWVGNKVVGPLAPGTDTGDDSTFSYSPDDIGRCATPPEGGSCTVQGQVDPVRTSAECAAQGKRGRVCESDETNNSLGPTDPFLCGP